MTFYYASAKLIYFMTKQKPSKKFGIPWATLLLSILHIQNPLSAAWGKEATFCFCLLHLTFFLCWAGQILYFTVNSCFFFYTMSLYCKHSHYNEWRIYSRRIYFIKSEKITYGQMATCPQKKTSELKQIKDPERNCTTYHKAAQGFGEN